MTREERIKQLTADIDEVIDKYNMETRCHMSRDDIRRHVRRSMVSNNFAFILADVANTFLLDCEADLKRFGVGFSHEDKYNFSQMMNHINAAKKWAKKSALPIYQISDSDNACSESDWWYNLLKLIDDRLGDDPRKTNMFLEYILAMPSEDNLFDVKYDDFRVFKK